MDLRLVNVGLPQFLRHVRSQLIQYHGVSWLFVDHTPAIEAVSDGRNIIKLQCAIYHRVRCQDLLEQCRAGSRQADNKDRIGALASGLGAAARDARPAARAGPAPAAGAAAAERRAAHAHRAHQARRTDERDGGGHGSARAGRPQRAA